MHYAHQWAYSEAGQGDYFKLRAARRKRFPGAGQVLLYSEYLQARDLLDPFLPPETIGARQWSDVIDKLKLEHKGDVEVAVYPYAGIQHVVAKVDLPEDA
jgi:hypothetical protein